MSTNYLTPFSDWLSISYPTSLSPHLDLVSFFNSLSVLTYTDLGGSKELYKVESGGSLFITSRESYVNISISGSLLSLVRGSEHMLGFSQILSSAPYNITRLDIAYDTPIAGSLTIQRIRDRYPDGYAHVANRKRQLQYILNQETLTSTTGTVYFQTNKYKGTIKLRVYDKAYEMLQSRNVVLTPTSRYELSVGRGASLRDFLHPSLAFWHFMPKELLTPPQRFNNLTWSAAERINYDDYTSPSSTDYQRLKFLIENHPVLLELVKASQSVTGGDLLLKRQIDDLLCSDAKHVAKRKLLS
jgi:hypothetical protein